MNEERDDVRNPTYVIDGEIRHETEDSRETWFADVGRTDTGGGAEAFVRIYSLDPSKGHHFVKRLEGRRVRITIETLEDTSVCPRPATSTM